MGVEQEGHLADLQSTAPKNSKKFRVRAMRKAEITGACIPLSKKTCREFTRTEMRGPGSGPFQKISGAFPLRRDNLQRPSRLAPKQDPGKQKVWVLFGDARNKQVPVTEVTE